MQRTMDSPAVLLLAGFLATFGAYAIIRLGEIMELAGGEPLGELLIAVILLKLYPENGDTSWSVKRILSLVLIGTVLALFWVAVFAWGNTVFPVVTSEHRLAIFIGVLSAVVAAPIYEEKVVRGLLLGGLSRLMNRWIAALAVSAVFALAHNDAVIWAFIVSIVLCWLALVRRIGTLQRAIAHGTINAWVMLWYFTSGFGLFP